MCFRLRLNSIKRDQRYYEFKLDVYRKHIHTETDLVLEVTPPEVGHLKSPIGGMYWFLGQWLPINIIMRKVLLFMFHVANLEPEAFAHKNCDEQRRLDFDGLAKQGRQYLAELGLRKLC